MASCLERQRALSRMGIDSILRRKGPAAHYYEFRPGYQVTVLPAPSASSASVRASPIESRRPFFRDGSIGRRSAAAQASAGRADAACRAAVFAGADRRPADRIPVWAARAITAPLAPTRRGRRRFRARPRPSPLPEGAGPYEVPSRLQGAQSTAVARSHHDRQQDADAGRHQPRPENAHYADAIASGVH